jgi:hypothetical protein
MSIDALIIIGLLVSIAVIFSVARYDRTAPNKVHLGPWVNGKNFTKGTKLVGDSFEFPQPTGKKGHVHALVVPVNSLAGKKKLVLRYTIMGDANFHPYENQSSVASISLMIERADNYRVYAPSHTVKALSAGNHLIGVSLTDLTGWMGPQEAASPTDVAITLREAKFIHICFGDLNGDRAHGVFADAPATFRVNSLKIYST